MYLKFNPLIDGLNDNPIAILFHIDALKDINQKNYIYSKDLIKICAGKRKDLIEERKDLLEKRQERKNNYNIFNIIWSILIQ